MSSFPILQLFESVRGMPLFMISNGLLKLLCQIVATTCDLPLSRYIHVYTTAVLSLLTHVYMYTGIHICSCIAINVAPMQDG